VILALRTLYALLSRGERRRFWGVFGLASLSSLLGATSVASVLPFIAVLSDPEGALARPLLREVYALLPVSGTDEFLVVLGVFTGGMLIVANGLAALTQWTLLRFAWRKQADISSRLLLHYLQRPYAYFLTRSTSDLSNTILLEAQQVVQGAFIPALDGAARGLTALALIGLLVAAEPVVAGGVVVVFGGGFGLVYAVLRRRQRRLGSELTELNARVFQAATEPWASIKYIKLNGLARPVARKLTGPAHRWAARLADNLTVGELPKHALEALAFGSVIAALVALVAAGRELSGILPVAALFALAGYRLMPALQAVFRGATSGRFHRERMERIRRDLVGEASAPLPPLARLLAGEATAPGDGAGRARAAPFSTGPAPGEPLLRLEGVSFRYPGGEGDAVHDVDAELRAGDFVALVGTSGSGKTTLLDLVLGLLRPTQGTVRVMGRELDDGHVRGWQNQIAYVPQHVVPVQGTLRSNLTFGMPPDRHVADAELVEALELAGAAVLVDRRREGLDQPVAEVLSGLSGGERQRLALARALVLRRPVLILDEPLSAVDPATARAVWARLRTLPTHPTILAVTHRREAIAGADRVLLMDGGRLVPADVDPGAGAPDDGIARLLSGVRTPDGGSAS
jgi:ABC-type multidrug transport system fused ATPase/permease subunit